jgi:hypothetical protein
MSCVTVERRWRQFSLFSREEVQRLSLRRYEQIKRRLAREQERAARGKGGRDE